MGNSCNCSDNFDFDEYENQDYTKKRLVSCNNSNNDYKQEEYYIRRFELEKFMSMSNEEGMYFDNIIKNLMLSNTKFIPKLIFERKLSLSNVGRGLLLLIRHSYFFDVREHFYSVSKLRLLFFLICSPEEKKT